MDQVHLFSKDMLKYKYWAPAFLLIFCAHCSGESYKFGSDSNQRESKGYELFTLDEQEVPPGSIKSIQFGKTGSVSNAPVITLGSNESLNLSFDSISEEGQQFRLEITHHDIDWSRSSLPIEFFIDGQQNFYVTGGRRSRFRDVNYYHYSTTFPDQSFRFLVSGNYLVHVYDNESNDELFTLPFFVSENVGRISSRSEKVFNRSRSGRAFEQLFTLYNYPEFVQFPQFDLSFRYAQNKLWGTTKEPDIFDTSVEGEVEFHLSRDQLYPADFDFNILDLQTLRINVQQILDVNLVSEPINVVLREDVQNFSTIPIKVGQQRFGTIDNDRTSRYVDVNFSFVPRLSLPPSADIYLAGDFNQWHIQPEYKLSYDSLSTWWKTKALIKQGSYAYKYVQLSNDGTEAIVLDDAFSRQRQEYTSFVYFLDPNQRFYRLLQAQVFYGN